MARFNEWGDTTPTAGTIGMTKMKNALLAADPKLTVELRNIRVNGQLRGCSGFVTDPRSGGIVYLNTEYISTHGVLFRSAKSTKDYTGGTNQYAAYDELPQSVVKLLRKG